MTWNEIIQLLATVATPIAVLLAWWQLRLTKQQSVVTFEDSLAREYREIADRLPIGALLGEQLSDAEYSQAIDTFYRYIDLSNEQVFLRINRRITKNTWQNWADGIKSNLSHPAFRRAWEEIKRRAPDSFAELRRLEQSDFAADPAQWR